MKTYNEIADNALKRIKEQHINQKEKRKNMIKLTLSICMIITALAFLFPHKQTPSKIYINTSQISMNHINQLSDVSKRRYDPELYECIKWSQKDIVNYFGKDLTPSYIPQGLKASSNNKTSTIYTDKKGKIVEDTLWLSFYHDYYQDGSPMITKDVSAIKGFSILASKIGLINDCYYIMPDNQVKKSTINNVQVTFGYRSMPFGPYDEKTHQPKGYYDLYIARFQLDGIEYLFIGEQMEEEFIKVVSSLIYGKEVYIKKS